MNFQFTFKHMETSSALQDYAEAKVRDKVQRFVTKPTDAHFIFSVNRHTHTAHLSIRGGDGFDIDVEESSADMYASVDGLADKVVAQLKRMKEKLKDHKQPKGARELTLVANTGADVASIDAAEILKYEAGRKRARGN